MADMSNEKEEVRKQLEAIQMITGCLKNDLALMDNSENFNVAISNYQEDVVNALANIKKAKISEPKATPYQKK